MNVSLVTTAPPPAGSRRQVVRRLASRTTRASGVAVAPFSQALTGLVLQVVAVRSLGAEGFGIFALLYSGLVVVTAVSSGLVGDPLTVLDRTDDRTRAALAVIGLGVAAAGGAASVVVSVGAGLLSWSSAVLFGVAVAVFLIEDLLRRALIANLRFWSVVVVDGACLVAALTWLFGASALGDGLQMTDLLAALLVNQTVGILVAVALLPPHERRLAPLGDRDVAAVLRYGSWRAAQMAMRPAALTLTRSIVVLAAGTLAFGELEAARVYTAPTMLLVNGAASYWFASYAARWDQPLGALTRRADARATTLTVLIAVLGVGATVLTPWAGGLVAGDAFDLDQVAVAGWMAYAVANAAQVPYVSLASVRGRHAEIVRLRAVEAALSLAGLALVLLAFDLDASWTPAALAVGAVACASVARHRVLGYWPRHLAGRAVRRSPGDVRIHHLHPTTDDLQLSRRAPQHA